MTQKDLFNQNEIAVLSDFTGDQIGRIEAKKGKFKANYFGMKLTRWFTNFQDAINWVEDIALRKMHEQGKIESPQVKNLSQTSLF